MLALRKRLLKIESRLISFDVDTALKTIVRNNTIVQEKIINLNTVGQLFDKGIDSHGIDLSSIGGDYSTFTLANANPSKKAADHINLKDTGDFYKTFSIRFGSNFIEIVADFIKENNDLSDRWGENITGLTNESKTILAQFIKPFLIQEIKRIYRA